MSAGVGAEIDDAVGGVGRRLTAIRSIAFPHVRNLLAQKESFDRGVVPAFFLAAYAALQVLLAIG